MNKKSFVFAIMGLICACQNIFAQGSISTHNQFIFAFVDQATGWVTVCPYDGNQNQGRIGFDQQLSFRDKSFFTCQIGSSYFTNNDVIAPFPANASHLTDGTSILIPSLNHFCDTVRTTWKNKNGVDIIQDIYPIAFTKSGQIVYKWRFVNNNGSPINVACQYLQDIQIYDPHAVQGGVANDGPLILTRWQYTPYWEQYPNFTYPVLPWFYIGFLFQLPGGPGFNPGLSAMGYLDYGDPLDLIKPFRMTTGDWYTLVSTIFGSGFTWPVNQTTSTGPDNAVLVEFSGRNIASGKTVEVGRTSYGTGEYEKCVGLLFSLVFYPHHLIWTRTPGGGFYTPNPVHIEKFVVDPDQVNGASNTRITLTVKDSLTLVDTFCSNPIGKSHTKPDTVANGEFIGPGSVAYFDWWACASPAEFCSGPVIDTLLFKATCGFCPPAFVDKDGDDECELPIIIDCAELDVDPPEFSDTLAADCKSASVNVHDWRKTDRGLKSITWIAETGTDSTKFIVTGPVPPINPCYEDILNHVLTIRKVTADSAISGCFDLTFTDCLGHQSFHTICLKPCAIIARPDSLPPVLTLIAAAGKRDTSLCSSHIDSFQITDNRLRDSGMCFLDTVAGTVDNMYFHASSFPSGSAIIGFTVGVIDSAIGGTICLRASDCANPPHVIDTCFIYCAPVKGGVQKGDGYTLTLEQNRPNPFSHITTFTFTIPQFGSTRLFLYDELGKEVARVVEGPMPQGKYSKDFDGSGLAPGTYIARLESGGAVVSRRIVVER